ncbi:MAG: hypothetical protein U0452_07390 [Anaerolineae bacterium]
MQINHYALYFSAEQVASAHNDASLPPFQEAWDALRDRQPAGPLDFAFRYRFLDEMASAERALGGLLRQANAGLREGSPIKRASTFVMFLQAFEMVRDAPILESSERAAWLDYAAAETDALLRVGEQPLHESLWFNLVRLASAIVLERAEQAQDAAEEFERVIRDEVRPQGHMGRVVGGEDGGSLFRQIDATTALVLTAEAGETIGLPLWEIDVRGVSALTAALLPHYYFYDTRKWKWDRGVDPEGIQSRFHRYGGYLEIANRRSPNKDIQVVLEDLRPLNTPLAGGWTTLSHGVVEKKKRRGLFG